MAHDTDKPSGRIRFAVEAAQAFSQLPDCELHMGMYHGVRDDGAQGKPRCFACLGGAAALRRYAIQEAEYPQIRSQYALSRRVPDGAVARFESSLEYARTGSTNMMFTRMHLDPFQGQRFEREIPEYDRQDPKPFYDALTALADDLEAAGY